MQIHKVQLKSKGGVPAWNVVRDTHREVKDRNRVDKVEGARAGRAEDQEGHASQSLNLTVSMTMHQVQSTRQMW